MKLEPDEHLNKNLNQILNERKINLNENHLLFIRFL